MISALRKSNSTCLTIKIKRNRCKQEIVFVEAAILLEANWIDFPDEVHSLIHMLVSRSGS